MKGDATPEQVVPSCIWRQTKKAMVSALVPT